MMYAIIDLKTEQLAGILGFANTSLLNLTTEVGFVIMYVRFCTVDNPLPTFSSLHLRFLQLASPGNLFSSE